jgi:protein-S-isoprenylcysteine O-methyltransferase Ste14
VTNGESPPTGVRLWLRILMLWSIFVAVLFIPAGSFRWPEAWLFLALYFTWSIPLVLWLKKHNPELLEERMKGPIQREQKAWDKVFVAATMPPGIAFILMLGLDAVRYEWSNPPLYLKVIGFVVMLPCGHLLSKVMRANTYLSKSVKIQDDHQVISTGPYAVVRHPMYVAVIAMLIALPLALGALYALIPAAVTAGMMVLRTALEDRTLRRELPGYIEYSERVRYRLVPGLW